MDTPAALPQDDLPTVPDTPRQLALGALVRALAEPVLVVSGDRQILIANDAARDLFGHALESAPALAHIRQPEAAAALERGFAALASGSGAASTSPAPHETTRFEARMAVVGRDAETVYRVSIAVLGPEAGFRGLTVSFHDISHIEEAEQQRRDFVANVSHELRSPLTVLSGFIETLRGPARNDATARENFLEIMERETQRMTGLVQDLLSLSKVEATERMRPRTMVSLTEVLRATLAALRPQIEDAGLAVTLTDRPDLDPLPGDRDQLVQVFHNLVENAVKYGRGGGRIELTVEGLDSAPAMPGPCVRVTVQDHGEGIDAIHLPRLTERFYRVDGHRSRAMGGTGLGLAIVKHILNRHRGKLVIRSERGHGSAFSVLLPRA